MASPIVITNVSSAALEIGNGRVAPAVSIPHGGSVTLSLDVDHLSELRSELDALGTSKVKYTLPTAGVPVILRMAFTAGITGAADDVVVAAAGSLPYNLRVLDTKVLVTAATGVSAATATLRSAASGGGTALSGALAIDSTGRKSDTLTATAEMLQTAGLFLHRSDRAAAGEVIITAITM